MPTEAELFAEVVARPDDDEPRLALARLWGGDRERYVVSQLEGLAAARARKPRSDGLEMRDLLRGHERAWAGPISERVIDWYFVRGFPEWVVVDAASFAREWQDLVKLAPIRHLDLAHATKPETAQALFQSAGLEQLVSLSFNVTGPHFDPVDGRIVTPLLESPRLKKLKFLDLRCTRLTVEDQGRLVGATNLPALECVMLDGLEEQMGEDWDGSIQTVYPSEALAVFEARFGKMPALHYTSRHWHPPARHEF